MDQLILGIGTRLQHTLHGQGVIVGIKYATYLISFLDHGIKEIDKVDDKLEEIIPENVSTEIETTSDIEKCGAALQSMCPLVINGLAARWFYKQLIKR
jgi:hypothetical protein